MRLNRPFGFAALPGAELTLLPVPAHTGSTTIAKNVQSRSCDFERDVSDKLSFAHGLQIEHWMEMKVEKRFDKSCGQVSLARLAGQERSQKQTTGDKCPLLL